MFKSNKDENNKMAYDYRNKVSQSIIQNNDETNNSDSITFDYTDDEDIDHIIDNIPANENKKPSSSTNLVRSTQLVGKLYLTDKDFQVEMF